MRRALLLALATAFVAVAAGPGTPTVPGSPTGHKGVPSQAGGSVIGEGLPLKAYASITPTVHLFGDMLTAKLAVVADTKWVDPLRLEVNTTFAPYAPIRPAKVLRLRYGRFEQITWTWKLRCLESPCIPRLPPSDKFHTFHFPPAHIRYGTQYGLDAYWPPVEVISQISPGVARFIQATNHIKWQTPMTPVAKPTYRMSPSLIFWLAVALATLLGVGSLAFAGRWFQLVRPRSSRIDVAPGTPLERALAVLRYAHEQGDETLQRKAFERVADELGVERADELTRVARELAWSPRTPEDEEVEAFAVQVLEEERE
jgi:hypothetical protein